MISEIEAETKAKAKAGTRTDDNPWRVRGLMRYEEKDLVYADRKVVEAAQMSDPEEQRRHLQDVIDFFAEKYFVDLTVEGMLQDAWLDIVYVHKMLVESVDDPEPDLDYEEVMAEVFKEDIDDDEF